MKGKRLEPSSIEAKIKLVKHLSKRFNLWDSEPITKYIFLLIMFCRVELDLTDGGLAYSLSVVERYSVSSCEKLFLNSQRAPKLHSEISYNQISSLECI